MNRRPAILIALQLGFAALFCAAPVHGAGTPPPAPSDEAEISQISPRSLDRSDREFLAHSGKHVRRILIKDLEVFGPSMEDTAGTASPLSGALNLVNARTREGTVLRNLLFREGDVIDAFKLAESERLLRNLAFISDASITVVPVPGVMDSADVRVVVKESWTLQLSATLGDGDRRRASLAEKNLFGSGHQLSVAAVHTSDAEPPMGFQTGYLAQNLHGTFIDGSAQYEKLLNGETMGLALSRNLVSPVLDYAGGLTMVRSAVDEPDSLATRADNQSVLADLWAGRQFHFGSGYKSDLRYRVLFASARIQRVEFTRRPPVTPTTYSRYHDISYYLGSLALMQIRYYRTNLLFDYGRTEDVPYGFLARITYGLADDEFTRRPYAAGTLALGRHFGTLGYAAASARLGGYPANGAIEQGVLRMRTTYFSNLMHSGRFHFRQFVRAEYTTGIHRYSDESIDFNGDESIRGARYDGTVTGTERLRLNLEHVAFTPWKVKGLTFATFTFADLDMIGSGKESLFSRGSYSGLGFGLRLHKAAYGIGPLQLRFAWYPHLPVDHNSFTFSAYGEKRYQPIDFLPGSPEIVEY